MRQSNLKGKPDLCIIVNRYLYLYKYNLQVSYRETEKHADGEHRVTGKAS